MKRCLLGVLALLALCCPSCHEHDHEHGDHAHATVPEAYASLTNPLAGDATATAEGEVIYARECQRCHGAEGRGDGEDAGDYTDPPPADFTAAHTADWTDGYLFWRVTEGGRNNTFKSGMPAFESDLSEDDRWRVITYIQTLAP